MNSDSHPQCVLDVHLAEYAALMGRSTNWITLQYAFWPALALLYTLVATAYKPETAAYLGWGTCFGTLVLVETYYFALSEVYSNARYIEQELRVLVSNIVHTSEFWNYERYLRRRRGTKRMFGEWFPWMIGAGASLFAWFSRYDARTRWDWLAFAVSLAGLTITYTVSLSVSQARPGIIAPTDVR